VKLRSGRLEVTSTAGIPRGAWLQIGTGENADYQQVRAVRGTTLKVGPVYWWHRTWWWLLDRPAAIGRSLRRGLCAIGRHRVTREDYGMRHCWCRKRREDEAYPDDGDEESWGEH
jgi:hypothetical protein